MAQILEVADKHFESTIIKIQQAIMNTLKTNEKKKIAQSQNEYERRKINELKDRTIEITQSGKKTD